MANIASDETIEFNWKQLKSGLKPSALRGVSYPLEISQWSETAD